MSTRAFKNDVLALPVEEMGALPREWVNGVIADEPDDACLDFIGHAHLTDMMADMEVARASLAERIMAAEVECEDVEVPEETSCTSTEQHKLKRKPGS